MHSHMTNGFWGTVLYFIAFKEVNMVAFEHYSKVWISHLYAWLLPAGQCLLGQSITSYFSIHRMMLEEKGEGRDIFYICHLVSL